MLKPEKMPCKLLVIGGLALTLGACGTSQPQNVPGLRSVVGNSLPGAQGHTEADQDRIDEHMARACPVALYSREECARHTRAAQQRRSQLAAERAQGAGM